MRKVVLVKDLKPGDIIWWKDNQALVSDKKRHAMSMEDGTVWLFLNGKAVEPPTHLYVPVVKEV